MKRPDVERYEAMAAEDDGRGLGLQWAGGGPFSHLVPSEAARIVPELCAYIRYIEGEARVVGE